ncbi:MAG: hybrid sensor histidine kinase/response regulator [Proteobacteria bacterium]|nr:hybrid sensor histidine kinase/response regulator [Pseudomonadota bacterium]
MFKGINILAVDDDELSVEMLAAILESRGAFCTKAANGREAMDILEANPDIDIVLLDLQMPVMDGFEVLLHCKSNLKISDKPIIVMATNHHEKLKSLQLGADDFMSKPYDLDELELRLNKLVQTHYLTQSAKQAKREFLSIASHELRTPLHHIMGLGELLDVENLGDEQRELVGLLKDATANMANTIKNILNYFQFELGAVSASVEPFSLRVTIQNALEALIASADKKGIRLECSIAADVSDSLIGPSFYIQRVLGILLENAVKFSYDGEIRIVVKEEPLGRFGSRFSCSISDHGIGIPAEFHGKIFEPFTQVDNSNTRKYGGIGLGLAIAMRLAEQMGGTITVQNGKGAGSSFNFTFYCHLEGDPEVAQSQCL